MPAAPRGTPAEPSFIMLEREADGDGGDHDADQEGEPLLARRGADQEAGLQILRGVARLGRGDADHAADGDGQRAKGRGRPAARPGRWPRWPSAWRWSCREMGLAEEPIRPTMRELTVTNRKPKKTISSDAARLAISPRCAPGTGLKYRKKNMSTTSSAEPIIADAHGEIMLRAHRLGGRGGLAAAHVLEAGAQRADDGGQRLEEGDQSGGGHRSRAHGTDIGDPQVAGAHLRDGHRAGIDRMPAAPCRRSRSAASAPARKARRRQTSRPPSWVR